MQKEGLCTAVAGWVDFRAKFPKLRTTEFLGRVANHLVMFTKAQFLVRSSGFEWGQGSENIDNIVDDVTK